MLNIYITRHGQTKWNVEKKVQGSLNSPLTELGIIQGKRLNNVVKKMDINTIYSSPLKRAVDTSIYAKGDTDIEIKVINELSEFNYGDWEGKSFIELDKYDGENHNNFFNNPKSYIPRSGEHFSDFIKRVNTGLNRIIDDVRIHKNIKEFREFRDTNILIVCHAMVVLALISILDNNDFYNLLSSSKVPQTSINHFVIDDNDRIKKIKLLDVSHL